MTFLPKVNKIREFIHQFWAQQGHTKMSYMKKEKTNPEMEILRKNVYSYPSHILLSAPSSAKELPVPFILFSMV